MKPAVSAALINGVGNRCQADLLEPAAGARALLRLDPGDDVAVALRELEAGERLAAGDSALEVRQPIPFGHKLALRDLPAGATVRKFGWPIGVLIAGVRAGDHVIRTISRPCSMASKAIPMTPPRPRRPRRPRR